MYYKCHLFQSSVPFLGHIDGRRGLECDPANFADVKSWPVPDCLKSVCLATLIQGHRRHDGQVDACPATIDDNGNADGLSQVPVTPC